MYTTHFTYIHHMDDVHTDPHKYAAVTERVDEQK